MPSFGSTYEGLKHVDVYYGGGIVNSFGSTYEGLKHERDGAENLRAPVLAVPMRA